MGFGQKLKRGTLPVFSVDTEQEAKDLIVMCCPVDMAGHYYARELADEQTLENLQRFSDRLAAGYALMQRNKQQKEARRG